MLFIGPDQYGKRRGIAWNPNEETELREENSDRELTELFQPWRPDEVVSVYGIGRPSNAIIYAARGPRNYDARKAAESATVMIEIDGTTVRFYKHYRSPALLEQYKNTEMILQNRIFTLEAFIPATDVIERVIKMVPLRTGRERRQALTKNLAEVVDEALQSQRQ
jgi:hypothetical protein